MNLLTVLSWLTQRRSWVVLLVVVCGLAVWGQVGSRPNTAVAQGRTNLVLAHYYAWYSPGSFGPGKTPFTPPSAYASTDGGTIQRHVGEAQSAGIDGFVQAWYGPDASQQTEPNFRTLLDVANGRGFKAAVSFEPISAFMPSNEARASALQTLLATHANHPAYLRVDGKPVIFFWANWALSVGDWEYIRSIADPNRSAIWIAEGGNTQYLGVFDGLYLYNIAWSANPAGTNLRWAGETRAAAATYGTYKYWAATAMPGFNDSLLGRGENTIVRDRGGGSYLQNSFSGAASSAPDLLVITSFNEWAEGSNIEPSAEFGSFYLDLTRDLIATYKAGGIPAAVAPPAAPPAEAGQTAVTETESEPATVTEAETESQPESADNNTAVQQQTTPLPTATPPSTPTPIATATPLADGRIVYIVRAGDTLISIAVQFGLTLDELYALNDLGPDALITIGQEITVARDETIVAATEEAIAAETPEATA
ncbi:MAG: LysM peptidoglycan-binding domain-containing protein, partial [Anaerolineales bacterium]|nr:LysM peptidoglycan-binding domain-containing protein [Anaerolineales bacterium]